MSIIRRRWNPSFKVPNRLILDASLSFSARRMGAVLFSRKNHLGACRRTQASLAKLAGCSLTTAHQELEDARYITRSRNYRYSETLGCQPVKSNAFVLCLYLHLQAGNTARAFPSPAFARISG